MIFKTSSAFIIYKLVIHLKIHIFHSRNPFDKNNDLVHWLPLNILHSKLNYNGQFGQMFVEK